MNNEEDVQTEDQPVKEKGARHREPYGRKLADCGQYTDLYYINDLGLEVYIKKFYAPYKVFVNSLPGEYKPGIGFVLNAELHTVISLLRPLEITRVIDSFYGDTVPF